MDGRREVRRNVDTRIERQNSPDSAVGELHGLDPPDLNPVIGDVTGAVETTSLREFHCHQILADPEDACGQLHVLHCHQCDGDGGDHTEDAEAE